MFIPPRLPPRPRPRPIPFPRPREPRPRPRLNPAEERDSVHPQPLPRTRVLLLPGGTPSLPADLTLGAPTHLALGCPWTGGTGSAPWNNRHSPHLPSAPHFLHTGAPSGGKQGRVIWGTMNHVLNYTCHLLLPFCTLGITPDWGRAMSSPGTHTCAPLHPPQPGQCLGRSPFPEVCTLRTPSPLSPLAPRGQQCS